MQRKTRQILQTDLHFLKGLSSNKAAINSRLISPSLSLISHPSSKWVSLKCVTTLIIFNSLMFTSAEHWVANWDIITPCAFCVIVRCRSNAGGGIGNLVFF
jgi:hypothetical protein